MLVIERKSTYVNVKGKPYDESWDGAELRGNITGQLVIRELTCKIAAISLSLYDFQR